MSWSAAQRAAVSKRMVKYWRKRRAAGTKAHPRRVRRVPKAPESFVVKTPSSITVAQRGHEVMPPPNGMPKVEGRLVVRFSGQEMLMSLDEAQQLQTGLSSLLSAVQAVSLLP